LVFTGPLRSPLRLQNTFTHECFMDEICAYVKPDPVAHRLKHLADARVIDVVKAARWSQQRSLTQSSTRPVGEFDKCHSLLIT
jgi:hypothetical protein